MEVYDAKCVHLFWKLFHFLEDRYHIFCLVPDDQLCDSGSEAMFADLCYFSVRSVQVSSDSLQILSGLA